jgi:hypothetical protein
MEVDVMVEGGLKILKTIEYTLGYMTAMSVEQEYRYGLVKIEFLHRECRGMLVVDMKRFLRKVPASPTPQASDSRGVVSPLQNWLITAKHEQTRLRTTDWRADLELSIADP